MYNLPVVLRRDGAEFKLGQVVGVAGSRLVHLVRELLLHGDRVTITAVLHPLEVSTVQCSTVQYSTIQYSTAAWRQHKDMITQVLHCTYWRSARPGNRRASDG